MTAPGPQRTCYASYKGNTVAEYMIQFILLLPVRGSSREIQTVFPSYDLVGIPSPASSNGEGTLRGPGNDIRMSSSRVKGSREQSQPKNPEGQSARMAGFETSRQQSIPRTSQPASLPAIHFPVFHITYIYKVSLTNQGEVGSI